MTPTLRLALAGVALLGTFVFLLLTVGSLGEPNPDVRRRSVAEVLAGPPPAQRFGDEELHVSGWYAELAADCEEPGAAANGAVPWLEQACPLRVLMPYQPAADVTQAELEANGLRLAAPDGRPFPARADPHGANLRLQQLVYVGHFNDPAAEECAPDLRDRCRSTLVVSDYDGLLR